MRAAVEGIDQGADFAEGREFDRETAALVPVTAIGRLLDQEEAAKLIRRLDREIPKRPAAASVRRMVMFAFESPWLVELRRRNSIPNIQAKAINWAMSPMR